VCAQIDKQTDKVRDATDRPTRLLAIRQNVHNQAAQVS